MFAVQKLNFAINGSRLEDWQAVATGLQDLNSTVRDVSSLEDWKTVATGLSVKDLNTTMRGVSYLEDWKAGATGLSVNDLNTTACGVSSLGEVEEWMLDGTSHGNRSNGLIFQTDQSSAGNGTGQDVTSTE